MAKYYGPDEVVDIKETEDGYKKLVLKNGSTQELSDKGILEVLTDEPLTDLDELRNKRCFHVVKTILGVLLQENVHIDDLDFINRRVILSINESCKLGNTKLWGVTDIEQTFAIVHRVLTKDLGEGEITSSYVSKAK